jgi:hypothetical protein
MLVATGDFNLIVDAADKNSACLNHRIMGGFRHLLNELELTEAPSLVASIHCQMRPQPTLCRIDRWFCSADWEAAYPNCLLQALPSSLSDHCPVEKSTEVNFQSKKRFHFESFWPSLSDFQEVVADAWEISEAPNGPMKSSNLKLQATARTQMLVSAANWKY